MSGAAEEMLSAVAPARLAGLQGGRLQSPPVTL